MSILNQLKKTKENFDPKRDKINSFDSLPAGEYPVVLQSSDHQANPHNKLEEAKIVLKVVSGDHKDRTEIINLAYADDLPEFVVDKNAKILLSLAAFTGVELMESDLQSEETIANAMKRGIGKQFKMTLKLSKNKKNPDFPYRNYEFDELSQATPAEQQVSFNADPFDVGEDEIPF